MERLTMTSDKGGLAFTFDLAVTCAPWEMQKIIALGEKLKEYEDAEENGTLLKLPCKIGDVVYVPTRNIISEFTVCSIEVYNEGTFVLWRCNKGIYPATRYANIRGFIGSVIGEEVFLTKEDAERALKEMEG